MQTFNIKLKFFLLALFVFQFTSLVFSKDQNIVKNIYIELDLKDNKNYRTKAIDYSYTIALARYLKWITLKESTEISSLISSINPKDYISGYSIENEKYKKDKYSALITVNFEQSKLEKFLTSKGIKYFSKRGPATLIIPVIKFENRMVLWDDPNPWFDIWLRRPLDSNLNLFILPSGEADDLITLSASDAFNLEYFKIKRLSNKYNATQACVLLINVKSYNKKYTYNLTVYDGLTQQLIFSTDEKQVTRYEFVKSLYETSNTFSDYFDNLWVEKNLENIKLETIVMVEVEYENYRQWIGTKKYLTNNEKVSSLNILSMSNNKALIKLNIISLDSLFDDLRQNNYLVKQNENSFSIKANKKVND